MLFALLSFLIFTSNEIGHTAKGSCSPTRHSKHLLDTPLLRTPSENPISPLKPTTRDLRAAKTWPPTKYENSTTSKVAQQKETPERPKILFLVFLVYFCPILRVAVFSCPVGGQAFPNLRGIVLRTFCKALCRI